MIINPPSFKFYGDLDKSKLLKAEGLQFYNFVTTQADKEGLSFINRSKRLSDGSTISIVSNKSSVYGTRSGIVSIVTSSGGEEKKPDNIFISILDYNSISSNTDFFGRNFGLKFLYSTKIKPIKKQVFPTVGKVIEPESIFPQLLGIQEFIISYYLDISLLNEWRSHTLAITYYSYYDSILDETHIKYCIGGKSFDKVINIPYSDPVINVLGRAIKLYASCYSKVTSNMIIEYPYLNGYHHSFIGLWASDIGWYISIIGFNSTGTSNVSVISITLPDFSPVTNGLGTFNPPIITSGFGFDGKTLLLATKTSDSNHNQKVYKLVFNELYNSYDSTEIYSSTPYYTTLHRVDTSTTTGTTHKTRDITRTLVAGDPIISHLKVDIDGSFCGVRHHSNINTENDTIVFDDDGINSTYSESFSESFSSSIDIIHFTNTGYDIITSVSGLNRNCTKTFEHDISPGSITSSLTESRDIKCLEVIFYSAIKNVLVYKTTRISYNLTTNKIGVNYESVLTNTAFEDIVFNGATLQSTSYDIFSHNSSSIFPPSNFISTITNLDDTINIYPGIGCGPSPTQYTNDEAISPITDNGYGYSSFGGIIRSTDENPAIIVCSSANNNSFICSFATGTNRGTLLVDFNNLNNYILWDYRHDEIVGQGAIYNLYRPFGITNEFYNPSI